MQKTGNKFCTSGGSIHLEVRCSCFGSIEKHESYKGSRIKRDLFKSSVGKLINADINGALNILRKFLNSSKGTGEFSVLQKIIGSGLVVRPVRITGNGIEAKL